MLKILSIVVCILILSSPSLAAGKLFTDYQRLAERSDRLRNEMSRFCETLDGKKRLGFVEEAFLRRWTFSYLLLRTELEACATVASHQRKSASKIEQTDYDAVTAACILERFNTSVFLATTAGKNKLVRRKLNEELPECAIPNDLYDLTTGELKNGKMRRAVTDCHSFLARVDLPAEVRHRTDKTYRNIKSECPTLLGARIGGLFRTTGKLANKAWYKVVETVAMAVRRRTKDIPYAVPTSGLVEQLKSKLLPGDIIITRKNWVMSNMFLPGFFKHGILYVGSFEDVSTRHLWEDPEVARNGDLHCTPCDDGKERRIIEAIGEGVSLRSLEAGCQADYVVVFRPRLKDQDIDIALKRAFSQMGKPYDFAFSFDTEDKLVCTELVYRCYRDLLNFKLEKIKGSERLPANAIIKKWRDERGTAEQELDLVAFIDKDLTNNTCHFATAEDLIEALDRPGRDGALHRQWAKETKLQDSLDTLPLR